MFYRLIELLLMPIMKASLVICLLLMILLAACSRTSSEELQKADKSVSSWVATAQTVSEAWLQGKVSKIYAQETLQTTEKELQKEADDVEKIQPSTSSDKTNKSEMLKRLNSGVQLSKQIADAVEHENHSAVAKQLKELKAANRGSHTS